MKGYETREVTTRMSVGRDMDGDPTMHLQLILSNGDDRDMDQAHFHTVEEVELTARALTKDAKRMRRAMKELRA